MVIKAQPRESYHKNVLSHICACIVKTIRGWKMTINVMGIALAIVLVCAMTILFGMVPVVGAMQANSAGDQPNNNFQLPLDKAADQPVHIMNIDDLVKLTKSNTSYVLVDARKRDQYDKEHLPGAVSIPLSTTDSYASKLNKDQLIVIYCEDYKSPVSTDSAKEFMKLGFTNIWDYKGGIKEWKDKGYPVYGK